ncbi:MAG: hypothetical protein AB7V61_09760 [Methylocystis sp.]
MARIARVGNDKPEPFKRRRIIRRFGRRKSDAGDKQRFFFCDVDECAKDSQPGIEARRLENAVAARAF